MTDATLTSRSDRSVAVVGAALAGVRTAQALRDVGFDGRITLVGAEAHEPYDRPPLSKQVLSGAWPAERASLTTSEALAGLGVELRLGSRATAVEAGSVRLDDGEQVPFTDLVIATGVSARRLPDQPDTPSVQVLRTLDDSLQLKGNLERAQSLLVIGGGFIGAEVASVARGLGVAVTMVEALSQPFARVLGEAVAGRCADLHREHGVRIVTNARIAHLADRGGTVTVDLEDGTRLEADCALVGVGTVPNTQWLRSSPIPAENGIPCDASGRVEGTPNVYAVGDVAAWQDPVTGLRRRVEHWTSATEQARVVAEAMTGRRPAPGASLLPYFWSDQYKTKLQMVGDPALATRVDFLHAPDKPQQLVGLYSAAGRLVAAVTFSAPHLLARFRGLVASGADATSVDLMREQLGLVPQ